MSKKEITEQVFNIFECLYHYYSRYPRTGRERRYRRKEIETNIEILINTLKKDAGIIAE